MEYITGAMTVTNTSLTAARIRALNAVFDEGSYSSAARALGISQPAVSQAVQDLERAFNVLLFERRGRRLAPTEFCMELAPLTDEIINLEKTMLRMLQKGSHLETGVLRVGIGSLMPGMMLIGEFQKHFPKIQVQAEYAIYSDIFDAVLDSRVDIGILQHAGDQHAVVEQRQHHRQQGRLLAAVDG